MDILQIIGVVLAVYTFIGLAQGSVFVKDRWSGRQVNRQDDPLNYWLGIFIYAALSLLMLFSPYIGNHHT